MEFEEEDDDQSRFEDIMYSSYLNPHPLLIPTVSLVRLVMVVNNMDQIYFMYLCMYTRL